MNKQAKTFLLWGGWLAIVFFRRNKSFIVTTLWIFAWAGFVGMVDLLFSFQSKRNSNQSDSEPDPRFNTPRKALRASLNYQISQFLFLFNPLLLIQSLLQIAGVFWEKSFGRPILNAEQYKQKANYILPVAGEWRVFNGGVTRETSHSWGIPTQRFAYDLVKFGQNGRSFEGDGRKLEDYFCFDAAILAPADGIVVAARDGIHDAPFVGTLWMDCLTRNIAGNSVLIKHADGEYCLLAHLKRGSVKVKAGETVKQKQEIGRCGHSGNSTEPHLHFQFQNGKSFYFSSGLPVKFTGFSRKSGEQTDFVELDYISKNTAITVGE
jgi:murein DD-endopeptidase MepM/ murein hydrolase activator NlpD